MVVGGKLMYSYKDPLWSQMPFMEPKEGSPRGVKDILLDLPEGVVLEGNSLIVSKDVSDLNIIHDYTEMMNFSLEVNVLDNVSCRFSEHILGRGYQQIQNVTWNLGKNAQVEHLVDIQGSDAAIILKYIVNQSEGSNFNAFRICHSGSWLHEHTQCNLNGIFSKADVRSLVVSFSENNCQTSATFKHHAKDTSSDHNVVMLVGRDARGVCYSDVEVMPGAENSKSHQYNKNIALADNSEMFTQPRLCIHNDQVECSHGATTGKLDQLMLNYMQARGISYEIARKLLILGYAKDILSCENSDHWSSNILNKLNNMEL